MARQQNSPVLVKLKLRERLEEFSLVDHLCGGLAVLVKLLATPPIFFFELQ